MFIGNTVFIQGAAATPIYLIKAMTDFGKNNSLKEVKVCHMHTEGDAPYTDISCEGIFRYKELKILYLILLLILNYCSSCSMFMGGNVRKAVADGRGDAIPIFLSEIPLLFYKKVLQPDVAIIQVI